MKGTRVWGNGCYDVFHFGHANFIRQAKLMGDFMIAGVHGDSDIERNKAKPVMDEIERSRMVSAVKWVDEVWERIPYGNILATLEQHNCDYCVHGDDIALDSEGNDIYQECKDKGRFLECQRTEGISTTQIIDRILLNHSSIAFNGNGSISRQHCATVNMPMPINYYLQKIREFSTPVRETTPADTILYTQGVFDLFHSGHVDFLEKCKLSEENSFVIVGILNDEEAKAYYGAYPITNVYERALALLSCRYIDKVVMDVPFHITKKLLDNLKVNYVYRGKSCDCVQDSHILPKSLGIYRTVDSENELTTKMIIERIVDYAGVYYERNGKKSESIFSRKSIQQSLATK